MMFPNILRKDQEESDFQKIQRFRKALEEAEEEFEAARQEEQEESAWAAAQGEETGEDEGDPSTGLPSEYAAWSAPQEDGQETADEGEVDAESETVETEDAGETEEAEEEIYA